MDQDVGKGREIEKDDDEEEVGRHRRYEIRNNRKNINPLALELDI